MPAGPIGTCWAVGSWSDTAWEAGTWEEQGAGPTEVLGTGDLTTEVAFWMLTLDHGEDRNTEIRDTLADAYGLDDGQDLTTVLDRFLDTREA